MILPAFFLLNASGDGCKKNNDQSIHKGRLEIKALCMNYTIKVLDEVIDTSLVNTSWTDESTGKTHTNVFALGSRCNFPATLKEGDVFYFKIDSSDKKQCAVCMAYYPTPSKKVSIKVIEQ